MTKLVKENQKKTYDSQTIKSYYTYLKYSKTLKFSFSLVIKKMNNLGK